MPSRICCPQNHSTRTISAYEAAMALAEGRPIGACKKCGMDLQYQIEYAFGGAASEKERSFVVARAVRLGPRRPEGGQCDSFLLVLQDVETGKQRILPTHWFEGQANTQRGGHVAPLLTMADWTRLFSQLGVTCRESKSESARGPINCMSSAAIAGEALSRTGYKQSQRLWNHKNCGLPRN